MVEEFGRRDRYGGRRPSTDQTDRRNVFEKARYIKYGSGLVCFCAVQPTWNGGNSLI